MRDISDISQSYHLFLRPAVMQDPSILQDEKSENENE